MSDITLDDLIIYSQCPNKYRYGYEITRDVHEEMIKTIILKSYVYKAEKEKLPAWKQFIDWGEEMVRNHVPDLTPEDQYKSTTGILALIQKWHSTYYLDKKEEPGLVNTPITLGLGPYLRYHDNIPLTTMSDQINVFDFKRIDGNITEYTGVDVYNDLRVHIRLWGFWRYMDFVPKTYTRIVFTKRAINYVPLYPDKEFYSRAEKIVKHISGGLHKQVYYPVKSIQCQKCQHQEYCEI